MSPMNLTTAARTAMMTQVILIVLVTVFCIGVVTVIAGAYPFQPSEPRWRLAAAVAVLGGAPQMSFMLMMIAFAAVFGGHFGVVRWTSVVCLLLAVVVLALTPLFLLDLFTERKLQRLTEAPRFTREGLRVAVLSACMAIGLGWGGIRGIAATRTAAGSGRRQKGQGLVVAQESPHDGAAS